MRLYHLTTSAPAGKVYAAAEAERRFALTIKGIAAEAVVELLIDELDDMKEATDEG